MSEIRDTLQFFRAVDATLDEQQKTNAEQARINAANDVKFRQIEAHLAKVDQVEATILNQIEVFREGINEAFRRLRDDLQKLREGSNGRH